MASKDAAQDELVGQTIAGRYRIISRLGAGGMGTAYRAWDEKDGMPVVIKIPKKVFFEDPKFAERFHREIRLLEGLTHPHIAPITDVGEHEGLPFVAMRFLPGGSLSNRRLRDDQGKVRPNPPGMLHLWLPAVADALDYVHSQGVVHRDVKPANIFFDAFWGAYLGDFGIAKIVEESETFDKEHTLTATHMGIGTQEYMCPEQFTPKAVLDGRADQYALAVMVYEMVAGTRPFTGATAHLIVEVTTQQPPPLQALRRDLPASLVEAVHRGLAKRPEERFVTCREFAEAVLRDVQPLESELDLARLLCPNPKCASILKLPTSAAGRKGKCPKCQMEMKVAADLGALWLLDEAHRQKRAGSDGGRIEETVGVIFADEGGLDNFKPVSSTTPIERAARKRTQPSSLMILGGLAAAALAMGVLVAVFGRGGGVRKKPPKPPVERTATYEEQLAAAEARLTKSPGDQAANEILGSHWCFREQAWDKGLSYLAKGKTQDLVSAAKKEIQASNTSPIDPGEVIKAAKSWWQVAATQGSLTKDAVEAIKKHAVVIYGEQVGSLKAGDDVEFATKWLDEDSAFRDLVGNKRPAEGRGVVIRNSIGVELKLIPAGTFKMGSDDGEPNERPIHVVRITKPFYLGVTEVTNAQWKAVMGNVPSKWKNDNRPVEQVSWDDAVKFCDKLSALPAEKAAGRAYRLPTEAEWEYACRAATTTRYSFGEDAALLNDYGWFDGNSGGQTHPVGEKKPNPWGLVDMHGNVHEWCSDWLGEYPSEAVTDPNVAVFSNRRVYRGGNWMNDARPARSAYRYGFSSEHRHEYLGVRIAMSLPTSPLESGTASKSSEKGGSQATSGTATQTVSPPIKLEDLAAKKPEEILALPPLKNSIGVTLKLIPAGAFQMGSNDGDPDEKPVHEVRITRAFYLGVTEVTNAQWRAVMGNVPSHWKDDDRPVEQVSWDEVVQFCGKLSALPAEKAAGRVYRLPTEAEWEYACRGGTKTKFSFGDKVATLGDFAWFGGNARGQTHAVGQKRTNPWGLHDMHGNVWEWCSDWYGPYGGEGLSDPTGPASGSVRVFRGGCWVHHPWDCPSARRFKFEPAFRRHDVGFRLALSPSGTSAPEAATNSKPSGERDSPLANEDPATDGYATVAGNPNSYVVLRVGAKTFLNREYTWKVVPKELEGLLYEPVRVGGTHEERVVSVSQPGLLYAAYVKSGSKIFIEQGWERVEGELSAPGGNDFSVFRKKVHDKVSVPVGNDRTGTHVFFKGVVSK